MSRSQVDVVADFLTMTRDIQDIYDPARPNDYDEYVEEKIQMAERRRQERQKQGFIASFLRFYATFNFMFPESVQEMALETMVSYII